MDNRIFYILPYFIPLAITTSVLAYTLSKRHAPGAAAFAWYTAGQALWIVSFILGMLNVDVSSRVFWENMQWVASAFVTALPIFAVEYTEYRLRYAKPLFRLALVIPAIFIICLFLDPYLHCIYEGIAVIPAQPFPILTYQPKLAVYIYSIYGYLLALGGLVILFRSIIHPHELYRAQTGMIILGFFIPLLGNMLGCFGVSIIAHREIVPFSFATGNLIIAWSLFRLRVFDVTPIARDKVFEAMVEPVVILNNQNLIVDVNSSMLDLLGESAPNVIGMPAKTVFENFPIPIKKYIQTSYASAEATFDIRGKEAHYQMTVWPMFDAHKKITGRIFISHDITAYKELEQDLRRATSELEDRVRARTRELKEAYDITLEGWARALELRDKETEGHTRRVTDMTLKIASRMNITGEELDHVRRGAILHDIGKMGIADNILLKPGLLTDEERAIIQQHPLLAYQLLAPISFLKKAMDIPYYHHEKWDGTGYPCGLKGDEIPLSARIFAIVDVWDAVNSERHYKKAWTREESTRYLMEQAGKHFDPRVLNVFLDMLDKGEI
jgi:PAS domain S-box-containing protein